MADISMCTDKDCPSRVHCYRYRARVNQYRQSYMRPERAGEKCDYYWSTNGWSDSNLTPMTDIEKDSEGSNGQL